MGIKTLQIVGYKNSGKTTLVEKLIRELCKHHTKVATIKHHGHGGEPEAIPATDSRKHKSAGAVVTAVEGDGLLQIEVSQTTWGIEEIVQALSIFSFDVLLIEGYKYKNYPKIVLVKSMEDIELLQKLNGIQAVISWIPIQNEAYPVFLIDEEEHYIKWIIMYLLRELER